VGIIRKGWAKRTDKVYSTGLVVAGRKVPLKEKDSSSNSEKNVDRPPKPAEKNEDSMKK
jgi:hypothetical protein